MSTPAPLPKFERAEYHTDPPAPDKCAYCHRGIGTQYFRVDGHLACTSCAEHAQSLIAPDSHKAFSRAVLFGAGGAVAGCLAYSLLVIVTGWTIGYAAIGVGWLVGKAMKTGSRGLGGRRYQITAAVLTYAAVAMSFIPIALHAFATRETGEKAVTAQHGAPATEGTPRVTAGASTGTAPDRKVPGSAAASSAATSDANTGTSAPSPYEADRRDEPAPAPVRKHEERKKSVGNFILGVGMLTGMGIVSPFLRFADSAGRGLLGLFIIFIGVSTAWRLTQRAASEVDGPYEHSSAL